MAKQPFGADPLTGELPAVVEQRIGRIAGTSASAVRLGNRVVVLGDSIVRGNDNPVSPYFRANSWPYFASILSGQQIRLAHNAGIAGEDTGQMLARFDTDVAAYNPRVVIIGGPTNDVGGSGRPGVAGAIANLQELVSRVRAIGAVPILCTITPTIIAPTARRSDVIRVNTWMRQWTAANGIILIDFYQLVVDPATGGVKSAYDSGDGLHPNPTGYRAMAGLVADTLAPLLPPAAPALPGDNGDPNNLLKNGLFITDTDSNGVPNDWTLQPGVTGHTISLQPGGVDVPGNWLRIDMAATDGSTQVYQSVTTGIVAAHKYLLIARMNSENFTGGANAYMRVRWTATANRDDVLLANIAVPLKGVVAAELTAPTGVSQAQVLVNSPAGSGRLEFAQMGLYNLTAMGVAA